MPRLPAIEPNDVPESAKPTLESLFAARGNYPNMFRTLAVRPEIMRSAAEHMRAVTEGGTVSQALKELCVVMVSMLNDCTY